MRPVIYHLFVLILWLLQPLAVAAQGFPAGVYMSFEAVEKRQPDIKCELEVLTRSRSEINFTPGHFHVLRMVDKCLSNKQFKKLVAYSTGERIYFRGAFIDQEYGFFGSSATGKYLPFFYPHGVSSEHDALLFAVALGGGIIPAIIAYSVVLALEEPGNASADVPVYFFDLENKQTYPLNNTTFLSLLRLYPDLLTEYESMDKTEMKIETYFNFMQRMN